MKLPVAVGCVNRISMERSFLQTLFDSADHKEPRANNSFARAQEPVWTVNVCVAYPGEEPGKVLVGLVDRKLIWMSGDGQLIAITREGSIESGIGFVCSCGRTMRSDPDSRVCDGCRIDALYNSFFDR